MQRGPGAFMPPAPETPAAAPSGVPMNGPQAGPSAQDPAAFLEQLKVLGLIPNGPMNAPQGVPSAKTPARPARTSADLSPVNDPLSALAAMSQTPPRPARKAKFEPGKPGQPKSGGTAHQLLKDPDVVRTLHEKISAWETENPKRTLMGSHIQQMLPQVSASQARTIKRLLDKARMKSTVSDVDGFLQQGAAQAMIGPGDEE